MAFLSKQTAPSLPPPEKRPRHIGFILDGNGRWAKKRGLPRKLGHREGAKTFKTIARYCRNLNIPKDKRHKDVVDYLNMYFNDREFKRTVVILPKSE